MGHEEFIDGGRVGGFSGCSVQVFAVADTEAALLVCCDKAQEWLKEARVRLGSWSKRDTVLPVGKGMNAGAWDSWSHVITWEEQRNACCWWPCFLPCNTWVLPPQLHLSKNTLLDIPRGVSPRRFEVPSSWQWELTTTGIKQRTRSAEEQTR